MTNPDDLRSTDDSPLGGDFSGAAGAGAFDQFVDEPFDEVADSYQLMNTFTEEIENVSASDWNLDADALWGGADDSADFSPEQGAAFDFPL